MKIAFSQLLEQAQAQSNGAPPNTVVKEVFHCMILKAFSDSDLAREVTFQGGTALRLFYGGQRYSEDLDFVIGAGEHKDFVIKEAVDLLRTQITDRFGLELEVKEPSKSEFNGVDVRTWQFKISIPGFERKQMIKVEFCNVPAHDVSARLLQPRFSFQDDTHSSVMLRVESEREILADKLTAIANRKYLKARDLWDLKFLSDRGITPDYKLVAQKLKDYDVTGFAEKLELSMTRLSSPDASPNFMTEMEKFLAPGLLKGLYLTDPPGGEYISFALKHMQALQQALNPQKGQNINFAP